MSITALSAFWFLPFVLPICLYVAFTDMAQMRITNQAVILLAFVFVIIGFFVMPFNDYIWRLAAGVIVLVVGIIINAAGAVGAGDAKFAAAAAPFIALGDLGRLMVLFAAALLAAVVTHRGVKITPLRKLAPDWVSWDKGKKFPMGMALGATLAIYLILGAIYGA